MSTEAIQTDVSAEDKAAESQQPAVAAERQLTPREAKMAAVLAARDAEMSVNAQLPGSTNDLPALYGMQQDEEANVQKDQEAGKQEEAKGAEPAEPAQQPSPVYERDGQQYMRLKVNGEDREVSLAQVQATMQKHTAADLRLQQASERMREVEARERQMEQHIQQQLPRPPAAGVDGADNEALMADARAIVEGLYEGDTEGATQRLVNLLGGRQAPTLDPLMIQQQAERVAQRTIEQHTYVNDLTKGQQQFAEKFPDIVADDQLFNLADQATIRISQENPQWPPTQVLMEAGKQVDKWLKTQRGEPPEQGKSENSRQANKQQLKPLPTAQRNATYVPPREPEIDTSPVGVIGRMRAGRGQV